MMEFNAGDEMEEEEKSEFKVSVDEVKTEIESGEDWSQEEYYSSPSKNGVRKSPRLYERSAKVAIEMDEDDEVAAKRVEESQARHARCQRLKRLADSGADDIADKLEKNERNRLRTRQKRARMREEELKQNGLRRMEQMRKRRRTTEQQKEKARERMRRKRAQMTEEERQQEREKTRLWRQRKQMTPKEREEYLRKAREDRREFVRRLEETLPQEELERKKEDARERRRARRAKMTPEQRREEQQKMAVRRMKRKAGMTEKEREEYKMRTYMAKAARMGKMTREERESHERKQYERHRKRYERMTSEQRERLRTVRKEYQVKMLYGEKRESFLERSRRYQRERLEKAKKDPEKFERLREQWRRNNKRYYERLKEKGVIWNRRKKAGKEVTDEQREARRKAVEASREKAKLRREQSIRSMLAKGLLMDEIMQNLKNERKETPDEREHRLWKQRLSMAKSKLRRSLTESGVSAEEIQKQIAELEATFPKERKTKPKHRRMKIPSLLTLESLPQPPNESKRVTVTADCTTAVSSRTVTAVVSPVSSTSHLSPESHLQVGHTHPSNQHDTNAVSTSTPPINLFDVISGYQSQTDPPPASPPPSPPDNQLDSSPETSDDEKDNPSTVQPPPILQTTILFPIRQKPTKETDKRKTPSSSSSNWLHGPRGSHKARTGVTRDVICDLCGNSYQKQYMWEHKQAVHNPNYVQGTCVPCGGVFRKLREFLKHFKTAHPDIHAKRPGKRRGPPRPKPNSQDSPTKTKTAPDVVCDLCGETFSKNYLKDHKDQEHNPNYVNKKCIMCSEGFSSARNFLRHYRSTHSAMATKERNVVCHLCGALFAQENSMKKHMYFKHGKGSQEKKECPVCHKQFQYTSVLTSHLRNLHPEYKLAKYKCMRCDGKFPEAGELKEHVREGHPGEYWPCPVCPVFKYTKLGIMFHIYCAKKTTKTHKHCGRMEEGKGEVIEPIEKIHVSCDICSRVMLLDTMRKHYLDTHGVIEEAFVCDKCGKQFKYRTYWVAHMESMHGVPMAEIMGVVKKPNVKNIEEVEIKNPEGLESGRVGWRKKNPERKPRRRGKKKGGGERKEKGRKKESEEEEEGGEFECDKEFLVDEQKLFAEEVDEEEEFLPTRKSARLRNVKRQMLINPVAILEEHVEEPHNFVKTEVENESESDGGERVEL